MVDMQTTTKCTICKLSTPWSHMLVWCVSVCVSEKVSICCVCECTCCLLYVLVICIIVVCVCLCYVCVYFSVCFFCSIIAVLKDHMTQ